VRFLGFAPKTLADISADIAKIAGAVGASGRGEEVVSQMQGHIEAVPDRIALPRPELFCEEWGKPLIVSQPWVGELVGAAGGALLGMPGGRYPPKKFPAWIRRYGGRPGAERATASHWKKSWPSASGREFARFGLASSTGF
jgi:hypothetical protein